MRLFKCKFNDTVLEDWSSNKAYLLGLIVTDGTIIENANSLGLSDIRIKLASRDSNILEDIMSWLEYKGRLYKSVTRHESGSCTDCLMISLVSEQLTEFVKNQGLGRNKTKNIGRVDVPEEFMKDYIRGFVDGDGSIHGHYTLTISSYCKEPLVQIQEFIKDQLSIEGNLVFETVWRLQFYRKEKSVPVLEWLYGSGISINRKKDLALGLRSKIKKGEYGGVKYEQE